nr:protein 7752 [Theama mediterranea]
MLRTHYLVFILLVYAHHVMAISPEQMRLKYGLQASIFHAASADRTTKAMNGNQNGDFQFAHPTPFYVGAERTTSGTDHVYGQKVKVSETVTINIPNAAHQHLCGLFFTGTLSTAAQIRIKWRSEVGSRFYASQSGSVMFTLAAGRATQFILLDTVMTRSVTLMGSGTSQETVQVSALHGCVFSGVVTAECPTMFSSAIISHHPISFKPIRVRCRTNCRQQRLLFGFVWYEQESSICYAYNQLYGDFPDNTIINIYKFGPGNNFGSSPPNARLTHNIVSYSKNLGSKRGPAFCFERLITFAVSRFLIVG